VALIGLVLFGWAVGTRNSIIRGDEDVKASWSEVLNQYKRRTDMVPNLVETVKGYAAHEKEVLENVTSARSRVSSITVTPEVLNDPAMFQKFQQAQKDLSGALSRLIAVAENYPNLKADTQFRDLMVQLEGTENRIAVARNRYIEKVADYNKQVRTWPGSMFGFSPKPEFTVSEEEIKVPKVNFK
jgi:LemA protein